MPEATKKRRRKRVLTSPEPVEAEKVRQPRRKIKPQATERPATAPETAPKPRKRASAAHEGMTVLPGVPKAKPNADKRPWEVSSKDGSDVRRCWYKETAVELAKKLGAGYVARKREVKP